MFDFNEKPELNITPLVDIMLVLLAILMVTTPAIIYQEKITLPDGSKTQTSKSTKEFLVVRVDKDRKVYINQSSMSLSEFPDNLVSILNSKSYGKDKPVYIKADRKLLYDDVMFVMTTLKQNGFKKISLQTKG